MNTKYETDRLILLVCPPAKAGPVTDFYNNNFEEFSLYEPLGPRAHTVSFHKKNLEYEFNLFLKGEFIRFYLFEKINPVKVIGTVSYRDIVHGFYDCCTIGYKMDAHYRRRGLCREAIEYADRVILNELNLNRIEATVRPGNYASINLLESIGFKNEGLLREKIKLNGEYVDHYLFSFLKRNLSPVY